MSAYIKYIYWWQHMSYQQVVILGTCIHHSYHGNYVCALDNTVSNQKNGYLTEIDDKVSI